MKLAAMAIGLVVLASCEKASTTEGKASGALTPAELELIHQLPSSSAVLLGGNFIKFQHYMQRPPFSTLTAGLDSQAPGLSEWLGCYSELPAHMMLSGVGLAGGQLEMRYLIKGVELAQ